MTTAGSNTAPEPVRARTNPLERTTSWRSQLRGELLWRIGGLTRVWSASKRDQILGIAAGVLLVVLALALGAYPGTAVWEGLDRRGLWLMPLLLVTVLEPIIIRHRGSTTEINLEAGILAYLLITVGPMSTLVTWLWCRVAMEFLKRHVLSVAIVNGYITTASVSVAALVYQLTPRLPQVSAADYLPALLAGLACLVVDLTLTEVCITVLGAPPEIPAWRNPAGVVSALATVALTGLGWGAAHLWSSPSEALLPLAIVTVPVLVLAHSYGELTADRRRMRQLVRLLHELESISTPHEALTRLEIGAEDIISTEYVRVRTAPPTKARREVGFRLPATAPIGEHYLPTLGADPEGQWLVARLKPLDSGYRPAELRALETVALVGGEAIARRQAALTNEWLATHDPLTGLSTRTVIFDRITQVVREAHARILNDAPRHPGLLAVALIDIDGFKQINDVHGHAAGDHTIVVVGQRLRDAYPRRATVARIGGDEFAVFWPRVDSTGLMHAISEDALAAIREPFSFEGVTLQVHASIGYSICLAEDGEGLLVQADTAMYHVKHGDKNGVARYRPSMQTPSPRSGTRPLLS